MGAAIWNWRGAKRVLSPNPDLIEVYTHQSLPSWIVRLLKNTRARIDWTYKLVAVTPPDNAERVQTFAKVQWNSVQGRLICRSLLESDGFFIPNKSATLKYFLIQKPIQFMKKVFLIHTQKKTFQK